jgi:hypothetical protein
MRTWLLRAGLSMVFIVASPMMAAEPGFLPASAQAESLKPVAAFNGISDRTERSVALFREAGKVIQNPRCLNCHPVGRRPTQGDDLHPHVPPMQASLTGLGVPSLPCYSCHMPSNTATLLPTIQSIPGNPNWSLAPASMSWQGKSLGEVCAQIKDQERNGGRSLEQIHEHLSNDPLVGWAWHPGAGRKPAPGTQAQLGELIRAWIDTGAACPAQ